MVALARCAVMAIPQPTSGLLLELWREQSLWSRTADRMKRRIEVARRTALLLVVAPRWLRPRERWLTAFRGSPGHWLRELLWGCVVGPGCGNGRGLGRCPKH